LESNRTIDININIINNIDVNYLKYLGHNIMWTLFVANMGNDLVIGHKLAILGKPIH